MDHIQLVGLDVTQEFLKPGRYLAASYLNDEDRRYTPYIWCFRLKDDLQLTYEDLIDTDDHTRFGTLTRDGTWRIFYATCGGTVMSGEFSDIWLFSVD